MTKVNLYLEGLGCANCAAKIENRTKNISGLESVVLDFSQSKLSFEYDELSMSAEDKESKITEISKIVKSLEPDVKVISEPDRKAAESHENHDHSHGESTSKRELFRLGISLTLFFSTILLDLGGARLVVLFAAYIISGYKVLYKSFRNILRGQVFDENFLMSLATFGAIAIGEYPEAVAVMIFYEIGEFFEDLAVNHSRKAIKSLINIRPDTAILLKDGRETTVSPEEVNVGDIIVVRPGMRIPLDGEITDGKTMIDTSALTGESIPVSYTEGDTVLSGTVVMNGLIKLKVSKSYKDSTVSRILELVENASGQKAKTEHFITKFARIYTPIVVGIAVLICVVPPLVTGASFHDWLYRSLIFLVISCPCALVLSVPLGFFSGIGTASKNGILVKGSNYLEALNQIDTVVFDKTGTLTKGKFEVTSAVPADGITESALLEAAYLCEKNSDHPIAKSVVRYIREVAPELTHATLENAKIEEISGKGIRLSVGGNLYLAGNAALGQINLLSAPEVNTEGTVIYLYKNHALLGHIVLNDGIKPDSHDAISALNALGKEVWMLTGDRKEQANAVANSLNIKNVLSGLMPEDKFEKVNQLKAEGKRIAFLGDGINDAPVLTLADVGISMGSIGSDAAIEASDVVFMTDEPSKLITAISISKVTKRIVTENIVFALGIKILIMLLGVLGYASMWMAIFGDVGVALLAVLNSTRILKHKL